MMNFFLKIKRNNLKSCKPLALLCFFIFSFSLQLLITFSAIDFSLESGLFKKEKVSIHTSHKSFDSDEYNLFEKETEDDNDSKDVFLVDSFLSESTSISILTASYNFPVFDFLKLKTTNYLYIAFRNFRI